MKNFNKPSVCGKGYLSYGEYNTRENKDAHSRWSSILKRCYSEIIHNKQPNYIECEICVEWLNFQNFAKWFYQNYRDRFQLDKDILFKGNKIYGPNTCCFVPREINVLLTLRNNYRGEYPIGVSYKRGRFISIVNINTKQIHIGVFDNIIDAFNAYKKEKENHIKQIANKYKSQITTECYNALINWRCVGVFSISKTSFIQ